jgi:hypothetical protein
MGPQTARLAAVVVADSAGTVVHWNPEAACLFLGRAQAEVTHAGARARYQPPTPAARHFPARAGARQVSAAMASIQAPNGAARPGDGQAAPVR